MKKSIGKRIAVLSAIGVMTMTSASAVFAMEWNEECQYMTFSDNVAEAHLNPDHSGYILIKDTSIWDTENGLTEIAGMPLEKIMDTDDGGKVEAIKIADAEGLWSLTYDYQVEAYGCAGQDNGFGDNVHMRFTDGTTDYYTLDIETINVGKHAVHYKSDDYKITKIEWYSSCVSGGGYEDQN